MNICMIKLELIVRRFKSRHFRRQCENTVLPHISKLAYGLKISIHTCMLIHIITLIWSFEAPAVNVK